MSAHSPYAPPRSSLYRPAQSGPALATRGQRFVTFWIDQTFFLPIFIGVEIAGGVIGLRPTGPTAIVISVVATIGYYVLFERMFGATIGKAIAGTRVISASGGRPTVRQLLGRNVARLNPLDPLSFLIPSRRGVGWHDSLSGTRVIRRR